MILKKSVKLGGRRLLIILFLGLFLYSGWKLIQYADSSVSVKRTNEAVQSIFVQTQETPVFNTPAPKMELKSEYQYIGDSYLPNMEKLAFENPDLIAWLHIPGGIVDLPVVYRDNTFYLNRDFYLNRSSGGTLFLDEYHPFAHDTQYMVIHGHNMHNGSMFGLLSHYRNEGYMEKHPTVFLTTLYRQEEYEVIGVISTSDNVKSKDYVPYIGMRKFQSVEQFNAFAEIIRKNALFWKEDAQMLPTDALLALSTCDEDDRIVVMCKRK